MQRLWRALLTDWLPMGRSVRFHLSRGGTSRGGLGLPTSLIDQDDASQNSLQTNLRHFLN